MHKFSIIFHIIIKLQINKLRIKLIGIDVARDRTTIQILMKYINDEERKSLEMKSEWK